MTAYSLAITHLSLTGLEQKKHGTYKRLFMLLEALSRTGLHIELLHFISPTEDSDEQRQEIQRQIRSIIKSDNVTVTAVPVTVQTFMTKMPWLLQQIVSIFSFRFWPSQHIFSSEAARSALEQALRKSPAIILAHRLPSMYALTRLPQQLPPVFFDLDDIEHISLYRSLGTFGIRNRILNLLSIPSLIMAELRSIRLAKHTFVCSAEDQEKLSLFQSKDRIRVIPNGIAIPAYSDSVVPAAVLLMVGTYAYWPNKDGADYFLSEVFPRIRAANPNVEIWFVGPDQAQISAFGSEQDGVKFLGFVESLADVYAKARIVICPIRFGSGTRVKLIEAAALSKPIVSTTLGAEGLHFQDNVHALLADDAETLAKRCLQLLEDDETCKKLSKNAFDLASDLFDRKKITHTLETIFSTPGTTMPAARPCNP